MKLEGTVSRVFNFLVLETKMFEICFILSLNLQFYSPSSKSKALTHISRKPHENCHAAF
jgi:hypothetical protein